MLYDTVKVMRFVAWRQLSEEYRKAVDGHSPWTGYKADEIIGQSLLVLIPSERHDRAREIIGNAAQGQSYGQFETVRIRKDGTNGLSSCRDICERKQFQSSLTKRMQELTTLIHFTERLIYQIQNQSLFKTSIPPTSLSP